MGLDLPTRHSRHVDSPASARALQDLYGSCNAPVPELRRGNRQLLKPRARRAASDSSCCWAAHCLRATLNPQQAPMRWAPGRAPCKSLTTFTAQGPAGLAYFFSGRTDVLHRLLRLSLSLSPLDGLRQWAARRTEPSGGAISRELNSAPGMLSMSQVVQEQRFGKPVPHR